MNFKGYKYRFPEKKKRYFVIFLSIIGYFFFLPIILLNLFKRGKIDRNKIQKILIVRNDGIGDFILSLPALHLLRETFQNAHITILIPSWQNELVSASSLFDEIIVFDDKKSQYFSSSLRLKKLFFEMVRKIPALKQKRFDIAIDIRGDFRNRIVIFLSSIPYRIGFDIGGMEYLLTHQMHYKKNVHEVEHFMDLISLCVNRSSTRNVGLTIPTTDKEIVERFLESNGIHLGRDPLVIVHPMCRRSAKEWPKTKFAELCDGLIKECKAKVIIIGSSEDTNSIREILLLMKEKPAFAAGILTLLQVAALMGKADLFIGNDAAPMHIAAAANTPVIALFGPTDPKFYGPYGKECSIVTPDIICHCESKKTCADPKQFCMDSISVNKVFGLAKGYIELKNTPSTKPADSH